VRTFVTDCAYAALENVTRNTASVRRMSFI
jgi:hypothetical protein